MQWWNQRFVNRRDYILENLETWNLNTREILMILLIDYFNEHLIPLTLEILAQKMHLTINEVDLLLQSLQEKGYVCMDIIQGRLVFMIDGMFEDKKKDSLDGSLFDLYESEFGRPLSQSEMQRLSDMRQHYEEVMIVNALREASIHDCKKFDYIEKILLNWQKRGLSANDYAEGKR
ncbi:MAG: DnaD domain protein [Longicatena sp.]|jgi:DNA replication protein|nr:DnaD domain protein [Longicatena sp.]